MVNGHDVYLRPPLIKTTMRQFFKFMFASMLGMVLALILFSFISLAIIGGMVSSLSKKEVIVSNNSILELRFDKPISERSPKDPFDLDFDFSEKNQGLNDILKDIEKAKRDSHIKGIFLHLSMVRQGPATMEEIRNALIDFKS